MAARVTMVRERSGGVRVLLGVSAVMLALLAGATLRQARPETGAAPAPANAVGVDVSVERAPTGGLAERYREERDAALARTLPAADVRGGMAELYAERADAAPAAVERDGRMGGLAELYRERAAAR